MFARRFSGEKLNRESKIMAGRFAGKVAVITGAGRGIGRETALLFAREGAKVVINDLGGGPAGGGSDRSVAQTVVDEIEKAGGVAVAETSSVSSMAGGKAVVDAAIKNFGRLDFLVNNAGIGRAAPILSMTEEDFDLTLAVHLKGCFATVRHAAEHLIKQGGAIVNMSSPGGFGQWGMSNYAAAKEGIVGFTRSIAKELGEYGVRANAVRPLALGTHLDTPEIRRTVEETQRLGIPLMGNQHIPLNAQPTPMPQNVAAAIAWLCTEESAPLSGREIFIAGAHISLVQEPELIRSQFNPDGWSLEALCAPDIVANLTYDQRNRYTGKP